MAILLMALACLSCNDEPQQQGSSETAQADSQPEQAVSPDAANPESTAEPANPCAMLPDAGRLRMRGTLQYGSNGLLFTQCNASDALPINDNADGLLAEQLLRMGNESGSLYVQLDVMIDNDGMSLEQLWRASPTGRSLGCREDLSGLLLLARGSEPYWGVEVRGSRVIALLMPTDDGSGIDETLYDFSGLRREPGRTIYTGSNPVDGSSIELDVTEAGSVDSESGDWFGMQARLGYSGGIHSGVAWPGELAEMPEEQPDPTPAGE
ncbi:MAG: hypothetical protein H7A35_09515 [Planctomycetales bacterium]|nr:hypothetical protein [bacterium]UNM07115.1 MAG: hypothetical protein H7A35_09515 [Planctomycetales bacterium]